MKLDECKEKLGEELARLVNEGAKVYLVENMRMGKVFKVVEERVRINVGSKAEPMPIAFEMEDFYHKIMNDLIVAQSRVEFDDNGNFVKVKPRATPMPEKATKVVKELTVGVKVEPKVTTTAMESGYINEKTGKFSLEKKRGYTEIRFERVKKKVELELDEAQIEKLKEMGLL